MPRAIRTQEAIQTTIVIAIMIVITAAICLILISAAYGGANKTRPPLDTGYRPLSIPCHQLWFLLKLRVDFFAHLGARPHSCRGYYTNWVGPPWLMCSGRARG